MVDANQTGAIRILLVEDNQADAELIHRELLNLENEFEIKVVQTDREFRDMLLDFSPHVILSDYFLPEFEGLQALRIVQNISPLTPFIIVTGSISEEVAVECMKAGVFDYLLKERLLRLPIAVQSAVNERRKKELQLQAEHVYRETEIRYRALFESSPDSIFLISGGKITECNTRALTMFECPQSSIIGRSPADLSPLYQYDGRSSPEKSQMLLDAAFQGKSQSFEWRFKKCTGELFDAEITLDRVLFGGKPYLQALLRDVSDRKRTERELEKWAEIFHNTKMGIVLVHPEHRTFELMNRAFADMHGYPMDELKEKSVSSIVAPEERQRIDQILGIVADSGHHIFESRHIRKDGSIFPVMIDITDIPGPGGEVRMRVVNVQDISEQKNLENQLFQAQRMESIGTLASGIAHDFNNILGIILGHVSLLEQTLETPGKFQKSVRTISDAVNRGANLVQQILTFAMKSEFPHEIVNVNSLIQDLVKMVSETFPKTITMELDLDPDIPPISIQQSKLYQALLNLCVNARDAVLDADLQRQGTITIRTESADPGDLKNKHPQSEDVPYIHISVSDSGIGIPEENLRRIFDPFYTTKGPGKGTGLGLAVVYGIIRSYMGFIDVESAVGTGTTFNLYLRAEPAGQTLTASASLPSDEVYGGGETVLVVEDEDNIMDVLKVTLQDKGYIVLTAGNGEEAVQIFTEHRDTIDLVITDMGLPKMSGFEVFLRIRDANPKTGIILASGYVDPQTKSDFIRHGVTHFIKKPYDPSAVLRMARKVLDAQVD
jgi:two-component system, cell cycle sensor histidine kinase and response regulator CckA